MTQNYFKTYFDYLSLIQQLTDEEAGRLFRVMLKYGATGEMDDLPGNERFVASLMKTRIDEDNKQYDAKCNALKKNSQKRWHLDKTDDS